MVVVLKENVLKPSKLHNPLCFFLIRCNNSYRVADSCTYKDVQDVAHLSCSCQKQPRSPDFLPSAFCGPINRVSQMMLSLVRVRTCSSIRTGGTFCIRDFTVGCLKINMKTPTRAYYPCICSDAQKFVSACISRQDSLQISFKKM